MKRLYFIRHGLSEANKQAVFSGSRDTPLSTEGRAQARRAGKIARHLPIDYIVSSPLSRAHDTAKIIAKEIGYPINKIHLNGLFTERHFGKLEGTPWLPDLDLDGISDVETADTIIGRAKLALEWLHKLDAHSILVVSHGSFGRALRSLIHADKPFENRTSSGTNKVPNAEIVCWIEN